MPQIRKRSYAHAQVKAESAAVVTLLFRRTKMPLQEKLSRLVDQTVFDQFFFFTRKERTFYRADCSPNDNLFLNFARKTHLKITEFQMRFFSSACNYNFKNRASNRPARRIFLEKKIRFYSTARERFWLRDSLKFLTPVKKYHDFEIVWYSITRKGTFGGPPVFAIEKTR